MSTHLARSTGRRVGPGSSEARPRFRADIQGLRAIAILTVLGAHARLGPFQGGFVGVDVFFAISGFLITQLLLREIARTGTLSIPGFYGRRARRILPAATLVLAATAVASGLLLGQVDAPVALRDILWAAFFAANIRFAQQGTNYFEQNLPPSPVQHYWSLAVEEQFYVVLPLLMLTVVVLLRHLHGRRASGPPRSDTRSPTAARLGALTLTIGVVTAASFFWSLTQTAHHPQAAYFSSLARAWELGLGALGAIFVEAVARRGRRLTAGWLCATSLVGVTLIAWPVLTYDATTPFPGWYAGVPVAGGVILLVGGGASTARSVVQRGLSIPPLRILGDLSYSLYLWHWPLLVIPAICLGHPLTLLQRLSMMALAVVLSAITYRFVETPFRTARPFRRGWVSAALYPATVAFVAGACVVGAAATALVSDHTYHPPIALHPGWPQRFHTHDRAVALVRASIVAAQHGRPIPSALRPSLSSLRSSIADVGDCDYSDDSVRTLCPRGAAASKRTIVVFGNSHARHWIPAFDQIGAQLGYRLYYLARSQCVVSDVVPDNRERTAPDTGCIDWRHWAVREIGRIHPDLVVLSTTPTTRGIYDSGGDHITDKRTVEQAMQDGYVSLLRELTPLADRTVFLLDIPAANQDPGTCLSTGRPTLGTCLSPTDHSSRSQAHAADEADVEAVRTQPWFCYQGVCPAVVGDMIVHRDETHMTNEYAASLADPLARALGLTPAPRR